MRFFVILIMIRGFNLLKYMIHANKVSIPTYIESRTDSHRNIHLTILNNKLTENYQKSAQSTIQYINNLLNQELQENKELNGQYQKMTKAVWVHLTFANGENSGEFIGKILSACCNQLQFNIHHGLNKNISLYRWTTEQKDLVTPYSMFYISCGAVIIENDHVLLVQEKNGGRKGEFGVPGGRADLGETIDLCAERELFEETGIKAKYKYIVHFRELTQTLFNGTDIYFACIVEVESLEGETQKQKMQRISKQIKLCDRELSTYKWVHLKEYREFSKQHAVGTQMHLGSYITQLYEKGFDFKSNENTKNTEADFSYVSKRDGVERRFIQHFLSK